jgi:SNF2 family DNA or RNA helicase
MNLRPYQEQGRDWLASKRHALLADEMRVGKTPQAILAAQQIGARRVLVLCPAIAAEHWKREFNKWLGHPFRVTVLERGVWSATGVIISGYERALSMRDILLKEQWDLVIGDECHYAKNPEAQRTKLVYGKAGLAHKAARLWALSGTPAPKHAAELWPMLRTFGAVNLSYQDFVNAYCRMDALGHILGTKEAQIPELRALLEPIMLRRTRKQVAPEMPGIDFQFLAVRPAEEADYHLPDDLRGEDLLAWLEAHPAVSAEDRQSVALAKVTPLVEQIVFAFGGGLLDKAVVFGYHVSPLVALANRLRYHGIKTGLITGATPQKERTRIQDEFHSGGVDVVVGNLLAAGTAIDLSAARHAYFLEMDWVPGVNAQAANRLVNLQRDDKVTVDVVTWPGSTDDRVQQVLMRRVRELSKLY